MNPKPKRIIPNTHQSTSRDRWVRLLGWGDWITNAHFQNNPMFPNFTIGTTQDGEGVIIVWERVYLGGG